jgi:hypothetical protein
MMKDLEYLRFHKKVTELIFSRRYLFNVIFIFEALAIMFMALLFGNDFHSALFVFHLIIHLAIAFPICFYHYSKHFIHRFPSSKMMDFNKLSTEKILAVFISEFILLENLGYPRAFI